MRIALVLALMLALSPLHARSETLALHGAAQGTTYHIKIVSPADGFDTTRLTADVEATLAEVDKQMSTYRPDSEISRFNRAPAGEWFDVSRVVVDVVTASRAISEKTGGAQDVTVGPLVQLWHFGPQANKPPSPLTPSSTSLTTGLPKGEGNSFKPPSDAEIQAARARVGYTKLDVRSNPPALRKQVDGLEVDLSSIASGYTIDRLADVIRGHAIENFMVELGGELRAAGTRADSKPWRIAIERPTVGTREMESAVELVNAAMATAGGSRHFFEHNCHRYSHIIDPATGRPVEHALASVTVAGDTCLEADGWDTPLVVLGPERGYDCAERHGIAALFIWRSNDGGDVVRTTTAWDKRFGTK